LLLIEKSRRVLAMLRTNEARGGLSSLAALIAATKEISGSISSLATNVAALATLPELPRPISLAEVKRQGIELVADIPDLITEPPTRQEATERLESMLAALTSFSVILEAEQVKAKSDQLLEELQSVWAAVTESGGAALTTALSSEYESVVLAILEGLTFGLTDEVLLNQAGEPDDANLTNLIKKVIGI
jgi:hypothetical protein